MKLTVMAAFSRLPHRAAVPSRHNHAGVVMKKLIALLPLLLLAGCADPYYSPGAWANYDPTYDWGFSGYERPIIPQAYDAPVYYPMPGYGYPGYGPAYGRYQPNYYSTWYQGPNSSYGAY